MTAKRNGPAELSRAAADPWIAIGGWLAKYGAQPWLVAVTVAVAAIHWHVFDGEVKGDDLTFHFAESVRIADCLRHLDFDLWNPSANGGYASAYYYQVLPQLASAIPAALLGHHLFFFQLSVFLPLVCAPACAYRGARLLGGSPWQAALAAFVIAFMNGESRWGAGNAGTFQVGLYTQTWGLCVFPLALGHGARWISSGRGLAPAIGWGAFSFLCHPFVGASLGIAWLVGVLCKFAVTWRLWLSPTMLGVLAMYIGGSGIACFAALRGLSLGVQLPVQLFPLAAVIVGLGLALRWKFKHTDTNWLHSSVREVNAELHRLTLLGIALLIAVTPVLLPLIVDRDGFGGFPHRVSDEVGPGFRELQRWYASGALFDFAPADIGRRLPLITLSLPILFAFTSHQRYAPMRWLWPPGIVFALWLGLGPHAGKVGDDLLPAVRALGAMQTVLGLGIGIGAIRLGQWIWHAPWDRWWSVVLRKASPGSATDASASLGSERQAGPLQPSSVSGLVYAVRTVVGAVVASVLVFVAYPGARALSARVEVLADNASAHRSELMAVIDALEKQPPGRKQAGPGTENHWWNLLPYAYGRVPALLQMGGGGLQASPNYDFLWTNRDFEHNAWIYDAPYLVFERNKGARMPPGDTVLQTEHFELRRLPAPGLVSPVHVVGVLPPGYRNGQLGHTMALAWGKTPLGRADRMFAYADWDRTGSLPPTPPECTDASTKCQAGDAESMPHAQVLHARRLPSSGDGADIVADVHAAATATFCLRESWHPRWRAYVDGIATPIRRITPDFPAVEVGPGEHTIAFRFERPRWALLVWLAWPLLTIAAWLPFTRSKPTS